MFTDAGSNTECFGQRIIRWIGSVANNEMSNTSFFPANKLQKSCSIMNKIAKADFESMLN